MFKKPASERKNLAQRGESRFAQESPWLGGNWVRCPCQHLRVQPAPLRAGLVSEGWQRYTCRLRSSSAHTGAAAVLREQGVRLGPVELTCQGYSFASDVFTSVDSEGSSQTGFEEVALTFQQENWITECLRVIIRILLIRKVNLLLMIIQCCHSSQLLHDHGGGKLRYKISPLIRSLNYEWVFSAGECD